MTPAQCPTVAALVDQMLEAEHADDWTLTREISLEIDRHKCGAECGKEAGE